VELTTDQKGAAAEPAIAHVAADLGVGVFKPLTDGERYDLIFDLRPKLVRVQCKTAILDGSVLRIPLFSARRSRAGFVKSYYSDAEADAIAAYSPRLGRCFYIPLAELPGHTDVQLRLAPCRNNQRIGVNSADDFALEARMAAALGP
jgi:hypothetical protein